MDVQYVAAKYKVAETLSRESARTIKVDASGRTGDIIHIVTAPAARLDNAMAFYMSEHEKLLAGTVKQEHDSSSAHAAPPEAEAEADPEAEAKADAEAGDKADA